MTGDATGPSQGPGPADQPQAAAVAPLALYRRYRPASFAEVKGQDHVTEPLRQALRSGRVNHAYLFSGPRGCGKTSSARILARSLNCEQGPTPDPCGVCASCVALAPSGPGSIDVIEIDAASHGGVDDARDLRERAFYAPASSRYKIYIIDEAHMVTREGFNALLKLVEEPPPHLKFVFATTEPEKVIATIRSRTHHYPFRLVPPAVLRELLEQILASEGVPYEPAVLPVVIRAGGGSVRDSLSVLDQLIAGSDESGLSYARAASLLGFTDDRLLDDVALAFAARDGAAVFGAIDRVVEAGHDPRRFAADLLDRLRDLIVLAAVPDAASTGLLDIPADRVDGMRAQAAGFGQAELTRAAEVVSAGLIEMRGATSPRLLLELMCAQVLLPAPAAVGRGGGTSGGDAALSARLDRLERRLDALGQASGTAAPARPAAAPAAERPSAPPARSAAGAAAGRAGAAV
ncbi:MAG TPA: DNA polymerase III subunit gamma and tau, partial [Streptosporangiaceae bacterium]|nr:DNA polymerase III subunit gamma and tau [Streptosporangiaceae bacterium]